MGVTACPLRVVIIMVRAATAETRRRVDVFVPGLGRRVRSGGRGLPSGLMCTGHALEVGREVGLSGRGVQRGEEGQVGAQGLRLGGAAGASRQTAWCIYVW